MDQNLKIPGTPPVKNLSKIIVGLAFEAMLVLLIMIGVFFRFNHINWSEGTDLHPDEYGMTSTLTQLSIPGSLADYFNTRLSPLSPYAKYDLAGLKTQDGPDNRLRWGQFPLIIIRLAGELSGSTGYSEIRLLGRNLSALADSLSLLFIFLIGRKLYDRKTGLLAAALSGLAVMQIQQSHFMTVDNFGGLFTTIGLFACVQIAGQPPLKRDVKYHLVPGSWVWYLVFGAAFGMALASKINLLPVGGMVLVAAFISIAELKLGSLADLKRIFLVTLALLALAFLSAGVVFRLTQPMSFRAANGDTGLFSLHPNQDWVDSMQVASNESSGLGGGPPGEQWAHRPAIIFPLTNMILWGMGLPLGVAAWLAFGWALNQLRRGKNWQSHLLPLIWVAGYFLFMGTRWVKSVRYFLPIYPFLSLLAAWGLLELWRWAAHTEKTRQRGVRMLFASGLIGLTLLGTLGWASAFETAIYQTPHTRLQAASWIYKNIPGPFELQLRLPDGTTTMESLGAPDHLEISQTSHFSLPFTIPIGGKLEQLSISHVQSANPGTLRILISNDPQGASLLGQTSLAIPVTRGPVSASLPAIQLQPGITYFLLLSNASETPITISRTVIANESWDEGLPMPLDGHDPFGQLYSGRTMEVRWPDDEHKRDVLLSTLAESDYLILPSQRAIWSTCRIPLTYPLTMEYYRALFDGRLGFEQAANFSAPLKLGPIWVSDVGGSLAWNKTPALPLFNHNWLAAEEAFSVYDHPPVWIFKKRADFSLENATRLLSSVDLSRVVVQSALNATGDWCPPQ